MSQEYQTCMTQVSHILKTTFNASHIALIPSSGSFAMEAVTRQLVKPGDKVLIVRNGWFSFRWT
jgi:aspartate aminotransferase-like enzyme